MHKARDTRTSLILELFGTSGLINIFDGLLQNVGFCPGRQINGTDGVSDALQNKLLKLFGVNDALIA